MSEPPRRYGWEDYLYPPNEVGAQVLRNKRGLTNFTEWFNAERQLTRVRAVELAARPELVPRTFDPAHWKAIHRYVFQDIYEWAGEFRTVNIGKDGHGFAPEAQLCGLAAAPGWRLCARPSRCRSEWSSRSPVRPIDADPRGVRPGSRVRRRRIRQGAKRP